MSKKKIIHILILSISLSILCGCGNSGISENITSYENVINLPSSDDKLSDHVPGEIIVNYGIDANPEDIAKNVNGEIKEIFPIGKSFYARISLPGEMSVVRAINIAMKTEGVIFAEPNYLARMSVIPNDQYYGNQYEPQNCSAEKGWDISQGDPNVIIAILDTGIDLSHPEFSGKITPGYDFVNNDSSPDDDAGHGTMVAGIAAARGNNSIGVAGAAWGCRLMAIKVMNNQGFGTSFNISQGILRAVNNGAKVISMSLEDRQYSQLYTDGVTEAIKKGVVVVSAMGNSGPGTTPNYPAACQGVIAVGAIDRNNQIESYSARGNHISMVAYGDSIYSTSMGGGYGYGGATSAATPFISGVCALILSRFPDFSPEEVKSQIEDTAVNMGSAGWNQDYGYGKPDIEKALTSPVPNKYGRLTVNIIRGDLTQPGKSVSLYDNTGSLFATTISDNSGRAYFYYLKSGQNYSARAYDIFTETTVSSDNFNISGGDNLTITISFSGSPIRPGQKGLL